MILAKKELSKRERIFRATPEFAEIAPSFANFGQGRQTIITLMNTSQLARFNKTYNASVTFVGIMNFKLFPIVYRVLTSVPSSREARLVSCPLEMLYFNLLI